MSPSPLYKYLLLGAYFHLVLLQIHSTHTLTHAFTTTTTTRTTTTISSKLLPPPSILSKSPPQYPLILFAFPNSDYNPKKKDGQNKKSRHRNSNSSNNNSQGHGHGKSSSKRHYRQSSSDEDDMLLPLSATTESNNNNLKKRRTQLNGTENMGGPNANANTNTRASVSRRGRNNRNSDGNNTNNTYQSARKRYQQQRRQQRKSNSNNPRSNWSSGKNKYSNRRPTRKVIDIDLTKPTFTFHGRAPPLQQAQEKELTQEEQKPKPKYNPNNPTVPIPQQPKQHIVSPSVLKQNEQNCIPYICGELPITYTNDPKTVHMWLCDNIVRQHGDTFSFIGFDTESAPNVPWRPGPESRTNNYRPDTVQLSTPHSALVLHLTSNYDSAHRRRSLLGPLQALLSDPTILKVGAGIDDDMLELYRWDNSLSSRSRFDIGGIGSSSNGNRVGLQRLVRAVVGVELVKSKRVTMSNWSEVPLSMKQLNYAARDAWAGSAVVETLGLMYEDTMHVDLIGDMVLQVERDMMDVDMRARERKAAKIKMKEMLEQMRQYSDYLKSSNDNMNHNISPGLLFSDVVQEEMDRLQQIINETSPDGLLFFPQESLGLDFSFSQTNNRKHQK